jgi:MFS family permease
MAVSVATFMLLLDITVVNVALPSIREDLGASFMDLQWVVDAYALTLAALVLTAGSLADRLGRRRLFVAGYLFEPGTQMAASILLVHYDPKHYPPDPQAFRPERFLEGAPEPYTWIPFGGGVRRCLGAAFAQLEMKIVISTILARARLRAPRAKNEKARFRGVRLLPSRGGEAVVETVYHGAMPLRAVGLPRARI